MLGEVAVLPGGAVDLEGYAALGGMSDFGCRPDCSDWRGLVEAFCKIPGLAAIARLFLEIAPREINPRGIAIDMAKRFLRQDIRAA